MHICCIMHRRLQGQHRRTAKLWLAGGIWVLFGSIAELAVMSVLWWKSWPLWHTAMRVFMIVLHFGECGATSGGGFLHADTQHSWRRSCTARASA
jgi:hypothetical protein